MQIVAASRDTLKKEVSEIIIFSDLVGVELHSTIAAGNSYEPRWY